MSHFLACRSIGHAYGTDGVPCSSTRVVCLFCDERGEAERGTDTDTALDQVSPKDSVTSQAMLGLTRVDKVRWRNVRPGLTRCWLQCEPLLRSVWTYMLLDAGLLLLPLRSVEVGVRARDIRIADSGVKIASWRWESIQKVF